MMAEQLRRITGTEFAELAAYQLALVDWLTACVFHASGVW